MAPARRERLVIKVCRRSFDVEDDEEIGEQEAQAIAENTLERCALNHKGMRALDMADTILSMRFYSLLGDALMHNTVLRELYLDNCSICDEALRSMSRGIERNGASALRALSLEDNKLKCRGAGHIARLLQGKSRWARTFGGYKTHGTGPGRGLHYLSVKGNNIASIGCKVIAEALMCSDDSLERLSLEANRIDDWGAGWFAMAMRNHNVLQCLDLHRNPIGQDGIDELRGACESANASLVVLTPKTVSHTFEDEGETEQEVEEEEAAMVDGQRLATVYVSEAYIPEPKRTFDNPGTCSGTTSASSSRPSSASRLFSRPGSASRREGQARRRNGDLEIDEPAGGPMLNSGAADSAQPRSTKASAAGLSFSVAGGSVDGTLRRPTQRATPPGPSTFSADTEGRHARAHPGERTAGLDEMETSTGLAPPSRWRRKIHVQGSVSHQGSSTGLGGCGASAARGLRRTQSAPGRPKHGMIMGPHAASGVYGCTPKGR